MAHDKQFLAKLTDMATLEIRFCCLFSASATSVLSLLGAVGLPGAQLPAWQPKLDLARVHKAIPKLWAIMPDLDISRLRVSKSYRIVLLRMHAQRSASVSLHQQLGWAGTI